MKRLNGALWFRATWKWDLKEGERRGAKGEQGSGGRLGEISELETGNLQKKSNSAHWQRVHEFIAKRGVVR